MLVALSKKERWEEAVAMFEDMKRSADTRPDVSCYVTMLHVCESAGFSKQVGVRRDFFGHGSGTELGLGWVWSWDRDVDGDWDSSSEWEWEWD